MYLSSYVPYGKANILVFNSFHIESYNYAMKENIVKKVSEGFQINGESPIVGIVVTTSPSFSLYKIVVWIMK